MRKYKPYLGLSVVAAAIVMWVAAVHKHEMPAADWPESIIAGFAVTLFFFAAAVLIGFILWCFD